MGDQDRLFCFDVDDTLFALVRSALAVVSGDWGGDTNFPSVDASLVGLDAEILDPTDKDTLFVKVLYAFS